MKRMIGTSIVGLCIIAMLSGCNISLTTASNPFAATENAGSSLSASTEIGSHGASLEGTDSEIFFPEMVEVGYATEGLGGWDEIVSLDSAKKRELQDLLQVDTWEVATDLPDGIGFGDGELKARDATGQCSVAVLGTLPSKSVTLIMVNDHVEKSFYYADASVGDDAKSFSDSLSPIQ